MRTFIKTAALAVTLAANLSLPLAATAAPVATIDFNAAGLFATSATQAGFTVTGSNSYVTVGGTQWCNPACAYNGTQYFWNYGPDVTVVSTAGALFSLSSFDASESFSFSGMSYTAPSIRVTGTLASGGTVSTTFTMDGIDDGMGALNDFQTFTLPTTFVGLNKIVFTGVGGTIPYFGIDNIVLGDGNAVPEPASLGLAGLALMLLAGLSVRRSRKLQA